MIEIIQYTSIIVVLGLPLLGMLSWLYTVFSEDGLIPGIIAALILVIFLCAAGFIVYSGNSGSLQSMKNIG